MATGKAKDKCKWEVACCFVNDMGNSPGVSIRTEMPLLTDARNYHHGTVHYVPVLYEYVCTYWCSLVYDGGYPTNKHCDGNLYCRSM